MCTIFGNHFIPWDDAESAKLLLCDVVREQYDIPPPSHAFDSCISSVMGTYSMYRYFGPGRLVFSRCLRVTDVITYLLSLLSITGLSFSKSELLRKRPWSVCLPSIVWLRFTAVSTNSDQIGDTHVLCCARSIQIDCHGIQYTHWLLVPPGTLIKYDIYIGPGASDLRLWYWQKSSETKCNIAHY